MTVTFLAIYGAIPFIILSTVGAANYIAPIIVTLLSAYFIGERVRLVGWVAVFVGFAGVVILLQPGADTLSPWAILPVIGASFYAMSHIITRTKCQDVPLAAMVLSLMIMMTVIALVVTAVLYLCRRSGPYRAALLASSESDFRRATSEFAGRGTNRTCAGAASAAFYRAWARFLQQCGTRHQSRYWEPS